MNFPKWVTDLSAPEWIAALTGLVCVWLTVKNKIENWPWGIVSVIVYGWFFWHGKLYASAALQIFFFLPCCIYGWWFWAKAGPTQNDDLPVRPQSLNVRIAWLLFTVALSGVIIWLMVRTNDPSPYADGAVTGLSITAQWLQAKKHYENWWYWIALDIIYVFYLFPSQHYYTSTGLYAIYLIVAVRGEIEWRRIIGKEVIRV